MRDFLEYELAPFPPAYFNQFGMLENTKSDLCTWFDRVNVNVKDPARTHFVIDGGLLIHKVKWTIGQPFSEIITRHIDYIHKNLGKRVTVVFDGYDSITTKSAERNRRENFSASANVFFSENMPLKVSQEKFLFNTQ